MDADERTLTTPQAAQLMGRSAASLEQDRWRNRGIPYIRMGRRIRYLRSDVDAYIEQNRVIPTNKSA